MVYSLAASQGKLPKVLPPEAAKWKALALTKKSKHSVHAHIPQRQFIGNSYELTQKLNTTINNSLNDIKNVNRMEFVPSHPHDKKADTESL